MEGRGNHDRTGILESVTAIADTMLYSTRRMPDSSLSGHNELMVAADSAKGGSIKLPIHVKDLSLAVWIQLHEMECKAQGDFIELGLDPYLDFQVMIGMVHSKDHLEFFLKWMEASRSITLKPYWTKRKGQQTKSQGRLVQRFWITDTSRAYKDNEACTWFIIALQSTQSSWHSCNFQRAWNGMAFWYYPIKTLPFFICLLQTALLWLCSHHSCCNLAHWREVSE